MHGVFGSHRPPPSSDAGASAAADRAKATADMVDARLDRAMLTMEAMWTLLRDHLNLTDDELANRLVEVDMSDGRLDGKVRRPPVACPDCGRTTIRRLARCIYCGTEIMPDPFG